MIGLNVVAADTVKEADRLATSQQQQFLNLIRGRTARLSPPVDSMEDLWHEHERALVQKQLSYAIVGDQDTIRKRLPAYLEETGADECIVASQIYDHEARLKSYQLLAGAVNLK
ncbi:LLM class flavin-dependent oxidoreductase, partial [Paenibacillus sepulcri]|nr:LLM class flavin-dependent oxidoreductase [Paenibacillus sepulcri]